MTEPLAGRGLRILFVAGFRFLAQIGGHLLAFTQFAGEIVTHGLGIKIQQRTAGFKVLHEHITDRVCCCATQYRDTDHAGRGAQARNGFGQAG